jgi:hypothetical protein
MNCEMSLERNTKEKTGIVEESVVCNLSSSQSYVPYEHLFKGIEMINPNQHSGLHTSQFEIIHKCLIRAFNNKISIRLVYKPDELVPICFVEVTDNNLELESVRDYLNSKSNFQQMRTIICRRLKETPQMSKPGLQHWSGLLKQLKYPHNEYLSTIPLPKKFQGSIMFGPKFDYEQKQWTNNLAMWICSNDPLFCSFCLNSEDVFVNSHMGLPVQYFVSDEKLVDQGSIDEQCTEIRTSKHSRRSVCLIS